VEGYGMTEDFAYSHSSTATQQAAGCVGIPLPGVEVRISEEGEILIKSPGQMLGYYKRPDLDAEVFTVDGFFRTGDRGERQANGLLKITGRVKEIFKTSKGEYVAPAPIENKINAHPLIETCMVSGLGQAAPYALLVLAEHIRPTQRDASVRETLIKELEQLLKDINSTLIGPEKMQFFVVTSEPWSIENGMLTPTMKIKRNRIEDNTHAQVAAWFDSGKKVLWAQGN
jgi:long-chain acyl-CoA synthetase